ncbi:sterol desaturase family protein [Kitasatospora sp. NBC_00240]|uniref:sterol desaturase family protein n=1 Tax=Kitasatospora sp. NBC_00240 TaxID=2903567 RepID=UPI002250920F|nr:sterol desaturase family protein [Kitasatospora sp. NBC_00240]MCX5214562.1 sterol desaturase family protein [Kitasatospora sp. NBC_00240]
MDAVLEWGARRGVAEVVAGALAVNVGMLVVSVLVGGLLVRRFGQRRVTPEPGPVGRAERTLVATAVVLNALVGVAGWLLWRAGWIRLTADTGLRALVELLLFTLLMDALMYAGHWMAHRRRLYQLAHEMHHRYPDPRPSTLFVLHPLEVLGFGGAWLVVLCLWGMSIVAVGGYVAVNLVFGLLGHLGVEPFPASVRRRRLFHWVALPMFHAGHHADPGVNLGFYTTVWDRLFGTVDPGYDRARAADRPPPAGVTPGREPGDPTGTAEPV